MEVLSIAIQHASWPVTVLIVFLVLRKPLSRLLRNIRVLRTGSLEVQFSEQLRRQGFSSKQLTAISELTEGDIDLFLLVSYTDAPQFKYQIPVSTKDYYSTSIERLQKAGLMQVVTTSAEGDPATHITTPGGRRVRSLLIQSTAELLRDDTQK